MKTLWLLFLTMNLSFAAHSAEAVSDMAAAANHFLAALTPEQKKKCVFELTDAERENWHFVPQARKGVTFKELTPEQRLLAHALLSSGLSSRGYGKALTIMSLDQILYELENKSPRRDVEMYYLSLFGTPNEKSAWGWRVEGHHLSLNFTTDKGLVIADTPSFFGSNPGEVRSGPRAGLRVLAREEDLGFELVNALSTEQRKVAIILEKAPADVLNMPGRNNVTKPQGIAYSALSDAQKAILTKLIREYLDRHRAEIAAGDWAKIEAAGLDKIFFAWAGALEPGKGHYYRVQGPTFILELDNTQNGANHVHALWRDTQHDFGKDLLKEHYEKGHHAPK
jgi:hypothetical protein